MIYRRTYSSTPREPLCVRFSRNSRKYKTWRRMVLACHGRSCSKCGADRTLHVHHIRSWEHYPELRFNIDNGMVLCKSCHIDVHPYMVKYYRKPKQKAVKKKLPKKVRKAESLEKRLRRAQLRQKYFTIAQYSRNLDFQKMPRRGSCKP